MVVQDGEASRKERKASGRSSKQTANRQNVQKVPLSPLSSPLLSVCLDLYIVSDAADEAPSGDHPMGDHTADAASSPPGGLSRVLVAIVTCEPLFFLLVSLSH